ncbi:GTP-binding protein [Acaryochloris sp. IP29b_bin.137]|uniref:GTP-binding protein n=1 Tax=Acaryochloris sp. IP29b_bin.137 TaxID=2969217 RepID=UPI00260E8004|nr:GTP-binding protein [Acaryochloris sp. IP29b_bin.137]
MAQSLPDNIQTAVEEATCKPISVRQHACFSIQHIIQQVETFPVPLQTELQNQLGALSSLNSKLNQGIFQIATFGFVSRGKSAVLNALFAETIFPVGPLNGETQWPRSVRWSPGGTSSLPDLQIELIDTPGLDEIEGQGRAQMAQEIAQAADLILFIIAGPPTALELDALKALRQSGRPLLIVVNKADLYPDLDAAKVYDRITDSSLQQVLTPEDILLTSAAPAPLEIRVEFPDGRTTTEWETPPVNIEPLRLALLQLIQQEGRTILTLNTLLQAQRIQRDIAEHVQTYEAQSGKACMGQYARLKAALIAICPLTFLDVGIGLLADLLLIGTLVKLYRLPTHRHQVNQLWGQILLSLTSLGLVEIMTPTLSAWTHHLSLGFLPWVSTGLLQAGVSLYGTQRVGRQTQIYLVKGYTWGPLGASTLIQDILKQLQPQTVLYRLREELSAQL